MFLDAIHYKLKENHQYITKAQVQRCIIHQIRSSTRFVSYKDVKALIADLKGSHRK